MLFRGSSRVVSRRCLWKNELVPDSLHLYTHNLFFLQRTCWSSLRWFPFEKWIPSHGFYIRVLLFIIFFLAFLVLLSFVSARFANEIVNTIFFKLACLIVSLFLKHSILLKGPSFERKGRVRALLWCPRMKRVPLACSTRSLFVFSDVSVFRFDHICSKVKLLSMTSGLSMGVFGTVKELIQASETFRCVFLTVLLLSVVGH